MRRLNLILLTVASIFLLWLLYEIGCQAIAEHLRQVGWWWPLVLAPYGLVSWLEALAWEYLLPTKPAHSRRALLFWLRLGGEALNQLTPTASLRGEPYKVVRLQAAGVTFDEATASVVIHKALKVLALLLYIVIGLIMAPFWLPEVSAHLMALSLSAAALGAAILGAPTTVQWARKSAVRPVPALRTKRHRAFSTVSQLPKTPFLLGST